MTTVFSLTESTHNQCKTTAKICSISPSERKRGGMLSTAADMSGTFEFTLIVSLLASCDAFRWGLSERVAPLRTPAARRFQDEGSSERHLLLGFVRTKSHSTQVLVQAQPHLVHDRGWPKINETSHSQAKMDSANISQLNPSSSVSQNIARTHGDENLNVEDELALVHLAVPQDAESYKANPYTTDPKKNGPRDGNESLEASGFYGRDMYDRHKGEDGGDGQETKGREDKWQRDRGEDRDMRGGDDHALDAIKANHTTPDVHAPIGYRPLFHPSSSGPQGPPASPLLEVGLLQSMWEAVGEDPHSSGYGTIQFSTTASSTTSTDTASPGGNAIVSAIPATGTGIDFGLLGSYTKAIRLNDRREEAEEKNWGKTEKEETRIINIIEPTTDPSTTISITDASSHLLEKSMALPAQRSDVGEGGVKEVFLPDSDFNEMKEAQQVMCRDWSDLAERGYVILNMMQNLKCEEFRVDMGVRFLKVMNQVFARKWNNPKGSWILYLSKPTHQQHQLLMNVASEHGVIRTKDVLDILGDIRKSLNEVGIQNYSAASTCQSQPSQIRSDYGKLFVVLVIIGSVCMVIITSGFIYICWQRRLPAAKTRFHAEELHFVENGCHDNPMLDVASDSQPVVQEKKPNTNGLSGGGDVGGENNNHWQVFVNKGVMEEEEEEQDTHL